MRKLAIYESWKDNRTFAKNISDNLEIQDEKKEAILNVSKEYDVNFDTRIPFEDFDADNGNYNMSSFTEYYSDIFKRLNIHFDSIFTREVSDGKYELILDNNILDLNAWDSLESVIDNVNSALDFYKTNDKRMEERMIEIKINNNRMLRLNQTETDKARKGIALELINDKGEIHRRDLISESDFVMLMNYYCYVKDNDYKDDFINPEGLNKERVRSDEELNDYRIEMWASNDDREQGFSASYEEHFNNFSDALKIARHLYDNDELASIMIMNHDKSMYCRDKDTFETFYISDNKFSKVPQSILSEYVNNWVNHKKLPIKEDKIYCEENGRYTAVDNSANECFVEEFETEEQAQKWLLGEEKKEIIENEGIEL